MYAVIVELKIKSGDMEAFVPLIKANAAASLANEPGCQQFDVCLDEDSAARVWLYEVYDDAAAFKAHLQTAHFKSFDESTAEMIADKRVVTAARVHPSG